MVESRESVIERLKEGGFWDDEAVSQLDPEYVEILLDIFRFSKATADAYHRLKEYQLKKAIDELLKDPRLLDKFQRVDAELGAFKKRV